MLHFNAPSPERSGRVAATEDAKLTEVLTLYVQRSGRRGSILNSQCTGSTVVACHLAKVKVTGSNPVRCSSSYDGNTKMFDPDKTLLTPGKAIARMAVFEDAQLLTRNNSRLECLMLPSANPVFEFKLIGDLAAEGRMCHVTAFESNPQILDRLTMYTSKSMTIYAGDVITYARSVGHKPDFDLIWIDMCCCPSLQLADGIGRLMRMSDKPRVGYVTVSARLPNQSTIPLDAFVREINEPMWGPKTAIAHTHTFGYGGGDTTKAPMRLLRFVSGNDTSLLSGPIIFREACAPLPDGMLVRNEVATASKCRWRKRNAA